MKGKLVVTILSLLLGLGSARVGTTGVASRFQPVPLTAHSTQVGYGRDGSAYLTIVKVFAVRGDGSYAESQTNIDHASSGALTTSVIRDKASGRETVIHPMVKMLTSYDFDGEGFIPAGQGCTPEIIRAQDRVQFLGRPVRAVSRETVSDDGRETTRSLYAEDLNCLLVYSETVWFDLNENVVGKDVYQVNQITLGDPNPALFDIPSDYTEASPSRAVRMEVEALGRGDANFVTDFLRLSGEKLAKSDAKYLATRYRR